MPFGDSEPWIPTAELLQCGERHTIGGFEIWVSLVPAYIVETSRTQITLFCLGRATREMVMHDVECCGVEEIQGETTLR
ncbi:hypothetical protein BGZ60DRAFT_193172 [Tricladium varicosporioides]|nr:hypothetical protein BGZ60DRAFT_193172 [Hymenoscyphus varicosporioides]